MALALLQNIVDNGRGSGQTMENDYKLRRMRLRLVVPGILCSAFIVSACLETTAVGESRTDGIRTDGTLSEETRTGKSLADKSQADKTQTNSVLREKAATSVTDTERVYGITFEANAVMAKVMSTGCTSPEHFEITHEVREGQCYLTLVRTKPDFCRRAPFAMDVIVPFTPPAACSALPVAFDNEIVDYQGKSALPSSPLQLPRQ